MITDNIGMCRDTTWATVVSASDYYPFGLTMEGRNDQDSLYRYGFNGKEKDDQGEWGSTHYDYGFRIYSPEIGKFLSVDPLTVSYPELTPYQFASNTPIRTIDLDGLEAYVESSSNSDRLACKTLNFCIDESPFCTFAQRIRRGWRFKY